MSCPECGSTPMGEGCYHICPNSVHFYSPEQERADEAWYGQDDHRERYAAERMDVALFDANEPVRVTFPPASDEIPF